MKLRRMFIAAILVVAIACVGVGYAALNDTLTFNGTITYAPTFDLVWSEEVSGTVTESPTIDIENDTFTISMDTTSWSVNVPKTIITSIENISRYDASDVTVSTVAKADTLSNYTIEVSQIPNTLAAGASQEVTITITMTSYPTNAVNNAEFSFTITAQQGAAANVA